MSRALMRTSMSRSEMSRGRMLTPFLTARKNSFGSSVPSSDVSYFANTASQFCPPFPFAAALNLFLILLRSIGLKLFLYLLPSGEVCLYFSMSSGFSVMLLLPPSSSRSILPPRPDLPFSPFIFEVVEAKFTEGATLDVGLERVFLPLAVLALKLDEDGVEESRPPEEVRGVGDSLCLSYTYSMSGLSMAAGLLGRRGDEEGDRGFVRALVARSSCSFSKTSSGSVHWVSPELRL
mmetsp:Transcript_14358/g.29547  ORF Transcript_14358/g.29547 Transcript_14358/m.29547 type:complete len:235 (-) Transcript_14358:633-1337(-)